MATRPKSPTMLPKFQVGDRVIYRTTSYECPREVERVPCVVLRIYDTEISPFRGVSYQLAMDGDQAPSESIRDEIGHDEIGIHAIAEVCLTRQKKQYTYNKK